MIEPMKLSPATGTAARTPGETVQFLVAWDLPDTPHILELVVSLWTEGKGIPETRGFSTQEIKASASKGEQQVAVTLPLGPYSFSGRLFSLQWKIELVWDKDYKFAWPFVLGPKGQPVVLAPVNALPTSE